MSVFYNFFRSFQNAIEPPNSFDGLSEEEIDRHIIRRWYRDFELTDAVSPSYDLRVIPTEGYRYDCYRDGSSKIPIIMAAATKKKLFELFIRLLDPLRKTVDVVLETSHYYRAENGDDRHRDFLREKIDRCVAESHFWACQQLLEDDGCTGVAVVDEPNRQEVQLNEHKLLIIYAETKALLAPFRKILDAKGVPYRPGIEFITAAEHIHSSNDAFHEHFRDLCTNIGADEVEFLERDT